MSNSQAQRRDIDDPQNQLGNAAILDQMNQTEGAETLLGTDAAPANLTPGIIYSNTRRSNLETDADAVELWAKEGYEHSKMYSMPLTLSSLARMGKYKRLNTRGASSEDTGSRVHDVIESPGGTVDESGSTTFVLRGGPDVGDRTQVGYCI
jgi:hypothetical protein